MNLEVGMHFKKKLIAAAVVAAMAAGLFCVGTLQAGDDGDAGESVSVLLPWSADKETIYFWYSDENLTNFLNSAAVSFGEREDVRVIPVLASDGEYLEAVNRASVSSGQVPDAYIISNDSLEKASLAGLASQIKDAGGVCNAENFPAAALSAVTYQDKLMGYPLFFETSALVYNDTYLQEWASQIAMKELLEAGELDENPEETDGIAVDEEQLAVLRETYYRQAIPATVDDILNIAYTFDVPLGVDGVMKWDVSDIFYNYWMVGNYMVVGGDSGDNPGMVNINNPETIQCLEVYKALNQFFFIESDTVDYASVVDDFCQGKLVFTIATTDVVKRLEDARAEGSLNFEYGIAPLPQVSGELQSRSMSVTNAVAVNSYSEHEELANRFAAYLVTECADSLYDRTGKVSANLKANADNGALQIFKMEYADSIPLPKMMETGNFWLQLEGLFSKVWNGADVTALVQELDETISAQISAAGK